MKTNVLLFVLMALLIGFPSAFVNGADKLHMKSGRVYEGRIVAESDAEVIQMESRWGLVLNSLSESSASRLRWHQIHCRIPLRCSLLRRQLRLRIGCRFRLL